MLDQAIVVEALRSELVEGRLPALRNFYKQRRQAMTGALEEFAPEGWRWTLPVGGFFILVELPEGRDATEALSHAIEKGVAYVPGQPFFIDGSGANTLRLAYSKESPEKIVEGIRRMCGVLGG